MKAQFEWQVGTDDGRWETIARAEDNPRGKWIRWVPRWAWCVLLGIVIASAVTGYLTLRQRYREAQLQIEFQIQSVIDLEATAYAQGELALFAAQQDEAAPDWYDCQKGRFQTQCSQGQCIPVLPAEMQKVEPRGDVAAVEVIEGQTPVRRVRFYRRTSTGWKHTAPSASFWETAVELTYGDIVFLYHQRDEPHIDTLTQHIFQVFDDVCAELRCDPHISLQVDFAIAPDLNTPAYLPEEGRLVLLSPWLAGIPVSGTWEASYLQELTYWTAYATFLQPLRHALTPQPGPFQRALADEYATWRSHRDWVETPILRRVVSVHGQQALRRIFGDLPDTQSLSPFLSEWLSLSPDDQPSAYFGALLNIEREALRAGRKDTFLLLQDDDTEWQAHQARVFDQAQLDPASIPISLIQVQEIDMVQDRARVTLDGPATTTYDGQSFTDEYAVFFLRQDADWKHASPSYLAFWHSGSPPAATSDPGEAP